jgi:hypothetical protein
MTTARAAENQVLVDRLLANGDQAHQLVAGMVAASAVPVSEEQVQRVLSNYRAPRYSIEVLYLGASASEWRDDDYAWQSWTQHACDGLAADLGECFACCFGDAPKPDWPALHYFCAAGQAGQLQPVAWAEAEERAIAAGNLVISALPLAQLERNPHLVEWMSKRS